MENIEKKANSNVKDIGKVMEEVSKLPPEMQQQIAEQVKAQLQGGAIELPGNPPIPNSAKKDGILKRLWAELHTRDPQLIDVEKVNAELSGIRFGLRCMMVQGVYRVRKGIDMTDDQILQRADATLTLISNVFMFVRAAEDVITRHGLETEYKAQLADLQKGIMNFVPQPSGVELEKLQAMLGTMAKGAGNGEGNGEGIHLSDSGDASVDGVGEESVLGDQPEDAKGG